MNTLVHSVLTQAASKICGSFATNKFSTSINEATWKKYLSTLGIDSTKYAEYKTKFRFKNYNDLMVFGAYMEDETKYKSDVADPKIKNSLLNKALVEGRGDYPHWVEHFWRHSLDINQGLKIDSSYITQVLAEAVGVDSWAGELGQDIYEFCRGWIVALVTLCCEGSTTLEEFRSAPQRAEDYWKVATNQYKNKEYEKAFYNLGKVCHLLQDMSTPAHVNNDPHAGTSILPEILKFLDFSDDFKYNTAVDDDQYEAYTGKIIEDKLASICKKSDYSICDQALPEKWINYGAPLNPVYNNSWKIFDYFKAVAQNTMRYDSDDADGTAPNGTKPMRWKHFHLLDFQSYGERQWNGDLLESACDKIAADLIPQAICYSAGVMLQFFYEVGEQITEKQTSAVVKGEEIYIIDDTDFWGEGEIYLTMDVAGTTPMVFGRIKGNSKKSYTLPDNLRTKGDTNSRTLIFIDGTTKELQVKSSCYDNDDWHGHVDHDEMGTTNHLFYIPGDLSKGYIKKQVISNKTTKYYFQDDASKYKLTYSITATTNELKKQAYDFASLLNAQNISILNSTHYKEIGGGYDEPILLNFNTMQRHKSTKKLHFCKNGIRSAKDTTLKFYTTENELFAEGGKKYIEIAKEIAKQKKNDTILQKLNKIDGSQYKILTAKNYLEKCVCSAPKAIAKKFANKTISKKTFKECFKESCPCCK